MGKPIDKDAAATLTGRSDGATVKRRMQGGLVLL